MYTDGASPTVPAQDMTSSGVNLHDGDVMNVQMTYNGTTLAWTITDATTGATFSDSAAVNIPSIVGSSTAYVGFTAATGGQTAIQDILSWTYSGTVSQAAATPTISPNGGVVGPSQQITLTDLTSGATIYYTTDGVAPTVTASEQYTTPFTLSTSATVEAIAAANGFSNSAVASAAFTVEPPADTPAISPSGGTITPSQQITITDGTSGAVIYYTTNGVAPIVTPSEQYSEPFTLPASATVEAIAAGSEYSQSKVAVANYTVQQSAAATPTFSPSGGTISSSQPISISDATSGATIYYTTNGTTPTVTPSEQYSTPFTLSSSATVEAIAVASGYANSAVASASYTVQLPQAATPTFSEGTGTYSGTQSITLSDTTSGATIYYAVNATPTTSSSVYTSGSPIQVSSNETLEAMAVASGYSQSAVATATYTIGSSSATISFPSFSSSTGLTLNGAVITSANRLRLTDGGGTETRSVFFTTPVNVQSFTNNFSFQLTNAVADGFTFTIQNNSPTAIGPGGGGLAYGAPDPWYSAGMPLSVAVKFDLYNNDGEGDDSTGLYTDGASPTVPAQDMTSSGVNLHDGDVMNVQMTYNGTTLTWTITDATTGATFTDSATVNIPSIVGSSTAYVGFTAATGGQTATQEILSWSYTAGTP
jgi:hypothetical protein